MHGAYLSSLPLSGTTGHGPELPDAQCLKAVILYILSCLVLVISSERKNPSLFLHLGQYWKQVRFSWNSSWIPHNGKRMSHLVLLKMTRVPHRKIQRYVRTSRLLAGTAASSQGATLGPWEGTVHKAWQLQSLVLLFRIHLGTSST